VDETFKSVTRDYQRQAALPGFRPGKAPRDVLSHLFADRVAGDVTQRLVDDTLPRALGDHKVEPVSQASVEPQKLAAGAAFSYKARVEVRPEIAEVAYDGFEVKRPRTTPTDEQVAAELETLRRAHSTLSEPDPARPSRASDVLTIAFTLDVAGKPVPESTVSDLQVELGGGQLLPELEGGLLGLSKGERKDITLTFGDGHPREEFRGQAATFHVEVTDVKERVLPALDAELAKDAGFDSLDALRADVTTKLSKSLAQAAEDAIAEQLVIQLCQKNPVVCPPSLVAQQYRLTEQEIVQTGRRQGRSIQLNDDMRNRIAADAEIKVRAGLLMAEIAKKAEVKITDDDIEKGIAELAEQTGKQVARVRAEYRDQRRREILIGMILEDKILDLIEAKATIVDEA
jgi:trigger factor